MRLPKLSWRRAIYILTMSLVAGLRVASTLHYDRPGIFVVGFVSSFAFLIWMAGEVS